MATKYVPLNFYGGALSSSYASVYAPGATEECVLTEIIASNTDTSTRLLTVAWKSGGNDIYLFKDVPMPASSVMNLNLYLPIETSNAIWANSDSANKVFLTVNGLRLEAVV